MTDTRLGSSDVSVKPCYSPILAQTPRPSGPQRVRRCRGRAPERAARGPCASTTGGQAPGTARASARRGGADLRSRPGRGRPGKVRVERLAQARARCVRHQPQQHRRGALAAPGRAASASRGPAATLSSAARCRPRRASAAASADPTRGARLASASLGVKVAAYVAPLPRQGGSVFACGPMPQAWHVRAACRGSMSG